ncbi:MAG: twin-arginine translocation signal domain-containing protein [Arenicellales bacterium]|jgi:ABC-type sugar transport system substrate-binding protein
MTTRRKLLAAATLAAVAAPMTLLLPMAHAEQEKPQLMFVQTAEDM